MQIFRVGKYSIAINPMETLIHKYCKCDDTMNQKNVSVPVNKYLM